MPTHKTDKTTIIENTIHLFKVQGYYNTSMADIGKACGLIKGSLYHHFKGKEDLALACLKHIHHHFTKHIFSVAKDDSLGDVQKLQAFTEKVEDYFLHSEGGCLLGNFALELSNNIPALKAEIVDYFQHWERALRVILSPQLGNLPAQAKAKELVALTQGSIMMMRLYGSSDSFIATNKQIATLLDCPPLPETERTFLCNLSLGLRKAMPKDH